MSVSVAFLGFGRLPKAFLRIVEKRPLARPIRITGIATGQHGAIADPEGFSLDQINSVLQKQSSFAKEFSQKSVPDTMSVITASQASVIFLATPLDPKQGEPGLSLARAALSQGKHVITVDKGPPAFAFEELVQLAKQNRVAFLYEGTVIDGLPIFSLQQTLLPQTHIVGFQGILTSTPGVVIKALEEDRSFEEGVQDAIRLGLAEADPSFDIEGFDAQLKACVLSNSLLGANITPSDVKRKSLRHLTKEQIKKEKQNGRVIRFIAHAKQEGQGISVEVGPVCIAQDDILASVSGTSSILLLSTDLMGEIILGDRNPGLEQSAYAFYLDFHRILTTYPL